MAQLRSSAVRFFILALGLLWAGVAIGQKAAPPSAKPAPVPPRTEWPADPAKFVDELTNMLRAGKIPSTIAAADGFASAWGSLNAAQQQTVITTCNAFFKARLRPKPYYESYLLLVAAAVQSLTSDQANLTAVLESAEKITRLEAPAKALPFAEAARAFLINKTLYFSKFYTLRVDAPAFTFAYIDLSAAIPDTIPLAQTVPDNAKKLDDWGSSSAETAPVAPTAAEIEAARVQAMSGGDVPQPGLEGAVLKFAKADLTFATAYDSSTLSGTEGAYMFGKGYFVGKGGKMDWHLAGLSPEECSAEMGPYNFPVKTAAFVAENSKLTYPSKLDGIVEGVFEYRSVAHKGPAASQYPRFMTYGVAAGYKNLGDNVQLVGGFALQGRRVSTASVYNGASTIAIAHGGKTVYRGLAKRFELADSVIASPSVASAIYHGADSLTQNGARLVYEKGGDKGARIRLYKDKGDFKEAPFFDSFHKVEITSEMASYRPDSNKIHFYNLTNKVRQPVVVESQDFFTEDRYADVQGLARFSPIGILAYNYSKTKNDVFNVDEVAQRSKLPLASVKASMAALAGQGFITYDPVTGEGRIGPKLRHYYSSVKKTKDYDYIAIFSIAPDRQNATLDLDSAQLVIYGVDRFSMNDSLGVYIKPEGRVIKMGRDRNFLFDGEISAGNFNVHGQRMQFDYAGYLVNMPHIDSVDVIPDAKKKSQRERQKASTRLSGQDRNSEAGKAAFTNGVLLINKPDNKSNLKRLPQYPIFDVQAPSFVYFDKPNILRGAYDKKVFFYVPPFKVDSISGANLAAISFNGKFHSDDIVPDFDEKLIIRPDKTLGFEHKVPAAGYQLYKGPGKFFGTLSMDGKGLRGKGTIKYLTTTVKSDDFVFYQDSVVARGQTVTMERAMASDSVGFPDGKVETFAMKWATKKDTMYITNVGKTPWYLYEGKVRMNGTVAINERGAFGSGLIKSSGSRVESPAYTFKQDRLSGRNAFFEVQSDNPLKPAVACKNVKFDFYVTKKRAEFSPEVEGEPSNEFPFARYKTSITHAVWDLEKKTVSMKALAGSDAASNYFYSTMPDQDSLNFRATSAVYDIPAMALHIDGVPYINVADGMVQPDSGKVTILENADMRTLEHAVLLIDTVNKYHTLREGSIKIKSRHVFEGEATYQYVNAVNDTLPVRFSVFEFISEDEKKKKEEQLIHTKSGAEIEEDKPLKIANGVLFKGKATMYAQKPSLEFDGYVKLDLRKTDTEWLKYSTTGETRDLALDLKGATDADGRPLTTGLYLEEDGSALYGVFVNSKHGDGDREIFSVSGVMNFNSATQEFKVGAPDRLSGKTNEGNIFAYSDSTGKASFEGKLNFLNKNESDYSILAAGAGVGQLDSTAFDIATTLYWEATLPPKAWTAMAKAIQQRVKDNGLSEAIADKGVFLQRVSDMVGQKVADDARKQGGKSIQQVYSKFAKGLVMTDVNLKWNKRNAAFYSTSKIGLVNVQGQTINGLVDGYIEIKKQDGVDVVNIYLQASEDGWFFFGLDDAKRLGVSSSITDFNDAIAEKANPGKARGGSYFFDVAEDGEKNQFLKHFRKDYLGQAINEADYPRGETREKEGESQDASFGSDDKPAKDDAEAKPDDAAGTDENADKPAKEEKKSKKKKKKKTDTEAAPAEGDQPTEGDKPADEKPKDDPAPAEADKPEATPADTATAPDSTQQAQGDKPAKKKKKKKKADDATPKDEAAPADEPKKEEDAKDGF